MSAPLPDWLQALLATLPNDQTMRRYFGWTEQPGTLSPRPNPGYLGGDLLGTIGTLGQVGAEEVLKPVQRHCKVLAVLPNASMSRG